MKKKTQPIPVQFLGAFKRGHRQVSKLFIDEELSWKLLHRIFDSNWKDQEAVDALTYLAKFNNEYHKNVVSKTDTLHNTPELRKDCGRRDDARNRDILSREYNFTKSLDAQPEETLNTKRSLSRHEELVIELIDKDDE